jgi:hypothetical protein
MQSLFPTPAMLFIQRETGRMLVLVELPDRNLPFHGWCLNSGVRRSLQLSPVKGGPPDES